MAYIGRKLPAPGLVVVLAASALIQLINTPHSVLDGTYPPVVPWIQLSAVVAGLLMLRRAATVAILVISGLYAALILLIATQTETSGGAAARLIAATATLAYGMAVVSGSAALRSVARTEHDAAQESLRAEGLEAATSAANDESFRISRALHDTVINTLAAIRMGVRSAEDTSRLRQRCADDLALLDGTMGAARASDTNATAATGSVSWLPAFLLRAQQRAQTLGIGLTVRAADQPPQLSRKEIDAAAGALAEALTNVAKHSGAREAVLTVSAQSDAMSIVLQDAGRGTRNPYRVGGGISESIERRCERAGLTAHVASRPSRGTSVTILWNRGPSSSDALASRTLERAFVWVVASVAAWIFGLALFEAIVGVQIQGITTQLVGLTLFAGANVVAVGSASRRSRIGPARAALLVVCAAAVPFLATAQASGCGKLGTTWWGSVAGLALLITLALLTRGYLWISVGALAYTGSIVLIGLDVATQSAGCAADLIFVLIINGLVLAAVVLFQVGYPSVLRPVHSHWIQSGGGPVRAVGPN